MLQVAGPTPGCIFVEEKGLVVPRASRLQVQGPRQSLLPISLGAPGEKGGCSLPLLCHPNSNLLWIVCTCVQTHGHGQVHLFIMRAERQI